MGHTTNATDLSRFSVLHYMKTYGLTHEQLAMVSVVQRECMATKPAPPSRLRSPSGDVLSSRMIAYPFDRSDTNPGVGFPPTEPSGPRSGNARIGATADEKPDRLPWIR